MTTQEPPINQGDKPATQESPVKQVSAYQIERVRYQVQCIVTYLESEPIISRDAEYQLRSADIGVMLALADVVDLLPSPLHEEVKRLLAIREQLWQKRYPLVPPDQKAQEEESQL